MIKRCTSCNKDTANDVGSVGFKCPSCNKEEVIRCSQCRKTSTGYACSACKYEGP